MYCRWAKRLLVLIGSPLKGRWQKKLSAINGSHAHTPYVIQTDNIGILRYSTFFYHSIAINLSIFWPLN